MNAIVSVTGDWGIGHKGKLLVRNRADMRYFKDHTMGGTVICGRTTFESFPGGALAGRRNVVLSRDPSFTPEGAELVRSIPEALAAVANDDPDQVWLIGGQRIYEQLLDHCQRAFVTKNDVVLPADAFFPHLDERPEWQAVHTEEGGVTASGIPFCFVTYERCSL